MTCLRRTAFAVLALALLASPLFAKEVPSAPTRWFTDEAGVVPVTEADLLNRKLADFEQQTGAQFIIYVFRSLEGDPVEDFTIRAVDKWKVGQKKFDNGLVLFVFIEERKIRIEVGYGLEGTVTDAFASRVIREHMAPFFQRGAWGGGLDAGATAIMEKIRTGEEPVPPLQRRGPRGGEERQDIGIIPLLVILFVVFFVLAPMLSGRRRGCGGCFFPMFFFPGGGGGITLGGGGGGFGGGFSGGGFSGGGGGFGGGGATGGW